MTPKFSKLVDPVFEHILGLFERIENGQNPAPETERAVLIDKLNSLGPSAESMLAKYALASWVDEVLTLDMPWASQNWWNEHKLEWELFQSAERYHLYYEKAKIASGLPQKDVLEVFYICVVLGFLGRYRNATKTDPDAERAGLPRSLETWLLQMEQIIRHGGDRPRLPAGTPTLGAPPLEGPVTLIWSVFLGMALSVVFAVVAYLFFFVSR